MEWFILKTKLGKTFITAGFATIARCAFSMKMTKQECVRFFIVSLFIVMLALHISGCQQFNPDLEKIFTFLMGFLAREIAEFIVSLFNKAKGKIQDKIINKI